LKTLTHIPLEYKDTLFVHLNKLENKLNIHAKFGSKSKSYPIEIDFLKLHIFFDELYLYLNFQKPIKGLEQRLKDFGKHFFSPIGSLINESSEIRFIITEDLIEFSFDMLYFKDIPLFLQKPVVYTFSELNPQNLSFSPDFTALIISDKTADPENGTFFLKTILPSSEYYDIKDLNLNKLASIHPKDIILISAHGDITSGNQDNISLGNEKLYPHHLLRLEPKLVYFDSCKLGVSIEFIKNFRERETIYYVAPIISSEAGNSSTKTIEFFFEALKDGLTPSCALLYTRKRLYNFFEQVENYQKFMWRVFPFRIYQLN